MEDPVAFVMVICAAVILAVGILVATKSKK